MINEFYPKTIKEWRAWLVQNHVEQQAVWLVFYKKKSAIPSLSWTEAVREALCFGWIDSKKKSIDDKKYIQFFSKRKAKSTWSKVNKDLVQELIEHKLMTKAGLESIQIAKENGSWTILDSVEALIIPADLEKAFQTEAGAKNFFLSLSKSKKKSVLYWVISAKRQETRQKRIQKVVELASQKTIPKQFR